MQNQPTMERTVGVFTIVEVREGKGSDTGWGRLKPDVGWISLDYAVKIS